MKTAPHNPGTPPATPFVTGGGGFEYEDRVAAFVLAAMLAGQPPFGGETGLVRRIDWQTSAGGWDFDDLLLTIVGTENPKLAISCKAGKYVSSAGWDADARRRLWNQWTRSAGNPFRRGVDLLGVVTESLSRDVEGAWDRLLQEAIATDPARFMERLAASGGAGKAGRALVAGLECPANMAPGVVDERSERVQLIRHVRLWRRDLLKLDSSDTSRAVEWCRQSLTDGDRSHAVTVFDSLRALAAERRIRGGTVELRELVALLAPRYALKGAPDHEGAWRTLDSRSKELRELVSESTGNRVCFVRDEAMGELLADAALGRVSVIEGESGTGKSALAKRLTRAFARTLWLTASDLEAPTLDGVAANVGVTTPLVELIDRDRGPSAVLVIDGAERLSADGRRNAARLTAAAVRAARPWCVVVTTQEEAAERVRADLGRAQLPGDTVGSLCLELPDEEAIQEVLPCLPIRLAGSPSRSLLRALRNLKALDALAHATPRRALASFADIVEQVWDGLLGADDRGARANILKTLGHADADTLVGGVPSSKLADPGAQRVAEAMVRDGILVRRNERLFFRHDLLGDWARLLILVELGEEAPGLVSQVAANIRWAPAVRLYAGWLSQRAGAERQLLMRMLAQGPWHHEFGPLLDGLFRSPESGRILAELLTGGLEASRVSLVLQTFLAVATRPSDIAMMLRGDHPTGAAVRAAHRTPLPELWGGVVAALDHHARELAAAVPVDLGELARVWLLDESTAPKDEQISRACARLAVMAAREMQARLAVTARAAGDEISHVFEALLLAAPWQPEEVAQTALELAQRRPAPTAVVERVEAERKRLAEEWAKRAAQLTQEDLSVRRGAMSIGPTPHRKREPLPGGPSAPVSDEFRSAVLDSGALVRFSEQCAPAALEVLLACCLEDPEDDDPLYLDHGFGDQTGTIDRIEWSPPCHLRGPWLALLSRVPEVGVCAVVALVNAGTSEWVRLCMPRAGAKSYDWEVKYTTVVLDIGGTTRVFRGGPDVFGWYRGHGRPGHIVASALMALECWLYRMIEGKRPVEPALERLLTSGTSVALLGVLAAVARRHQELLNGVLRPLLSSWMLLDWDDALSVQAQMPEFDPLNIKALRTGWMDQEAEEWSKLPHRRIRLPWVAAFKLAAGDPDIVELCASARNLWRAEIVNNACVSPESAERLIALLDPANLTFRRLGDQRVSLEVTWPPCLAAKFEKGAAKSGSGIAAFELRRVMRQRLDGGQALTDAEAEEVWRAASALPEPDHLETEQEGEEGVNSPAVARAAAAAALEALAGRWLDGFTDRRAWCERSVRGLPPSRAVPGLSGVSIYTEHGEAFAGEWAVARLAAGDNRPEVRRVLAESMTAVEPIVGGQVLAAAVRVAATLGDDFGRLFNVVWLWAALRNLSLGWSEKADRDVRIAEGRRQRLIGAFVRGEIRVGQLEWRELRLRAARVSERDERRRRARRPGWLGSKPSERETDLPATWEQYRRHGFNWSVLERVIGPLPVLLQPSMDPALGALAEFDSRLIDLVLFAMRRPRRDRLAGDSPPDLFDLMVLGRICMTIAGHEDESFAVATWTRVATALSRHPKWCEAFFDEWFRRPREGDDQTARFHRRWRAMIDSATGIPDWGAQTERWSHELATAWSALLGVHERGSGLGVSADLPYLGALASTYATWAKRALTERWRLERFCAFLQKPGAAGLRSAAIPWIKRALDGLTSYLGREKELLRQVAGFCVVAWYQHREPILASAEVRGALVAMVQLLSRMRYQEIADVKEELEAAVGAPGESTPVGTTPT